MRGHTLLADGVATVHLAKDVAVPGVLLWQTEPTRAFVEANDAGEGRLHDVKIVVLRSLKVVKGSDRWVQVIFKPPSTLSPQVSGVAPGEVLAAMQPREAVAAATTCCWSGGELIKVVVVKMPPSIIVRVSSMSAGQLSLRPRRAAQPRETATATGPRFQTCRHLVYIVIKTPRPDIAQRELTEVIAMPSSARARQLLIAGRTSNHCKAAAAMRWLFSPRGQIVEVIINDIQVLAERFEPQRVGPTHLWTEVEFAGLV